MLIPLTVSAAISCAVGVVLIEYYVRYRIKKAVEGLFSQTEQAR